MSADVITGSAGERNLQDGYDCVFRSRLGKGGRVVNNKSPSRGDLKSTSEFRKRQLQVWHP